jgi:hypothetical protein
MQLWFDSSVNGASLTVVCLLVSIVQQHLFAAAAVVEQWCVICGAPMPQILKSHRLFEATCEGAEAGNTAMSAIVCALALCSCLAIPLLVQRGMQRNVMAYRCVLNGGLVAGQNCTAAATVV